MRIRSGKMRSPPRRRWGRRWTRMAKGPERAARASHFAATAQPTAAMPQPLTPPRRALGYSLHLDSFDLTATLT